MVSIRMINFLHLFGAGAWSQRRSQCSSRYGPSQPCESEFFIGGGTAGTAR